MLRRVTLFILVMMSAGILSGCASDFQLEPGEPLCLSYSSRPQLMELCEDVLAGMQFVVEKYDPQDGYIKTRPLRGGQFFEFWRKDNVGFDNFAEANVQSLLRSIELDIIETGDRFCVQCTSSVRRLSIPETDIVSFSQNPGIFTGGSVTMQKLRPVSPDVEWIELGADPKLEVNILKRIAAKAAKLKGEN